MNNEELIKLLKNKQIYGTNISGDKISWYIAMSIPERDDTISALRAQSEAERRIEEIMEWCLSDKETESARENIATERAQCDILEILEGKAE